MNQFKFLIKIILSIICLGVTSTIKAENDLPVTYTIIGNYNSTQIRGTMQTGENGIFSYIFNNITASGKISFTIQGGQFFYDANERTELRKDIPFEAIKSETRSMNLYFNVIEGGEYTITFNGTDILLTADEPYVEPEEPKIKYLIAGSFMGNTENNVSFELLPIDGSDNLYSFTFPENTVGILFFMIDAVINGSDNLYYGANDGINTPLIGSYNTISDINSKKVGSLFFEMKDDKRYTLTFDANTNTVILTTTDATNSPLSISAYYDSTSSDETIYPEFKIDFTDFAGDDYKDLPVTKFEITTWDTDMTKRKAMVYSYPEAEDGEMTLSGLLEHLKENFNFNEETGHFTDKEVLNSRGEYIYTDGDYLYRLYFTLTEGDHTRRYTVYSNDFTVNKDGNPLVLNAFYLIQLGNGESNYLTLVDDNHSYPYSVTDAYGQLGQSNQITFNKADFEDGTVIDFGDETIYKFTDKVLIRSNIPFSKEEQWRIHHGELFVEEEQEEEVVEIPVVNSLNNRNVLTDGRFMAVVNLYDLMDTQEYPKAEGTPRLTKPLHELTYKLKIWYNPVNGSGSDDSESSDAELPFYEASVPLTVTVPEPRVENNYIDSFYGTINNGNVTPAFPYNFQYQSYWQDGNGEYPIYDLNGARFHNLRKVLVIKSPNVTLKLGSIMQAETTGGFTYSYKYFDADGNVKKEVPFNIMAATDDDKLWTVYSDCVLPESLLPLEEGGLYFKEQVTCENTYLQSYPRWTDTDIKRIGIEDYPPVCDDSYKFKLPDWELTQNQSGESVEKFSVRLFMFGINTNHVYHPTEENENYAMDMMHNHWGLPQNSQAKDYFLVEFVNVKDGEKIAVTNNTDDTPKLAQQVISVSDMLQGKDISFIYNHHKVVEDDDYFYKDLEVRVSYLYPFNEGEIKRPRPQGASAKIENKSNLKGSVIKSQPMIFKLVTTDEGVFTDLEGIENNNVTAKAGKGYIEVTGGNAEIYNLGGMKIAEGSGRHEVMPGIYIVTFGNKRIKVLVY